MRDVSESDPLRGWVADERRAAALPTSLPLKRARAALQIDQELLYRDAAGVRLSLVADFGLPPSLPRPPSHVSPFNPIPHHATALQPPPTPLLHTSPLP